MIQEFSQRRTQIIESLKSRGIDIEDAPASLREQAALKTREGNRHLMRLNYVKFGRNVQVNLASHKVL